MNRVGPATNTISAMITARTMLEFDRNWMPRSMPDTAEATKQMVRTVMMPTRIGVVTVSIMPAELMPPPICRAPRPREQAEPKSVARIARMLMIRPPTPLTKRRPKTEVNMAENSCERPRRNVP